MRLTALIPVICLGWAGAASADHDYIEIGVDVASNHWQPTDSGMAPGEYAVSTRHNRRMLLDSLTGETDASGDLDSLQFQLDTDSPLNFRLRDTIRSRRSLMLEYRKDW